MKIISRKDAIELGLKFYFTGKPCKNGHITERFILQYVCRECKKNNCKKYYKKHKVERNKKANIYSLRYYHKNKNNKNFKNKIINWQKNNKKYFNEYAKNYIKNLDDKYIKKLLKDNGIYFINDKIIKLKRLQLKIKRWINVQK